MIADLFSYGPAWLAAVLLAAAVLVVVAARRERTGRDDDNVHPLRHRERLP